MKTVLALIVLMSFSSVFTYGQELKNKSKLIESIGQEKFQSSIQENPGKIKFLSAYESDGYSIEELPSDKKIEMKTLSEIPLKCDKENKSERRVISVKEFVQKSENNELNILLYDFQPDFSKIQMFKLVGTNKVLIIQSSKRISAVANKIKF